MGKTWHICKHIINAISGAIYTYQTSGRFNSGIQVVNSNSKIGTDYLKKNGIGLDKFWIGIEVS